LLIDLPFQKGSFVHDLLTVMMFPACAVCQELNQLDRSGERTTITTTTAVAYNTGGYAAPTQVAMPAPQQPYVAMGYQEPPKPYQ
jgi:Na+/glutamate symporter